MKITQQKIMSEKQLQRLVSCLRSGGVIAFPTETVYALAGDARNLSAIKRIFSLKHRPLNRPLSVLLSHPHAITDWASAVSPLAKQLADVFWPGPLTLIFNKKESVLSELTGGGAKIGLRVPDHPLAHSVLQAFGGGLAAPSANRSTRLSPTQAVHVRQAFGDALDAIVDGGGECSLGIESTVVDVSGAIPHILRLGVISQEAIQSVINTQVLSDAIKFEKGTCSRYRQVETEVLINTVYEYLSQGNSVTVLAQQPANIHHNNLVWITMPKEATTYAQLLYHYLHEAEQNLINQVLIEALPVNGMWIGISALLAKYAID